ncbi:LLM class flavin-dependent oxidoreductase [Bordetella hinzii]|uniref:LLM class flavin-dependent oxidoreductase n=2 Tax=Bordetella hinzii TaxID=103855 RepID=A0AAN1RT19_9BORD|nr:LLM class flavin-dependent oxidoreductase [Bordetella hinzii]AKQ54773.1 Pyrimidine monooxygenase RutA [Bordetella hinzii]AKQ59286.1 Pyrimidine monooxygenase RutA [Bordetella hinzii]AZW15468.1 LLM class flavin-dependent oxidoreductase [Bordetella hinzii]KCB23403.1 luciferase-like monooxygenase [Bordetella hinzii OH87 BAL007II]KCB30196.1 luciferase-like monooxygenase [Bordetella hinzii CA90 BAL1384]
MALPDLPDPAAGPADIPGSPLHEVLRQPLLLGLFLPIQSGGWSPSTLPRGTDWTFEYNAALTERAEALGFDLVFGLAQWLGKGGHGGRMQYRENSLDPFVTTAALGARTRRILLISTIQILYGPWHPLHLAKFGATLDHITGGRWGLNMVTGNLRSQALMFGRDQIEHDLRYEMADEFTRILRGLWRSEENLSFAGRFWSGQDSYVSPRPRYGRPILVNATGSPAGMDYAARHSDLVFITSPAGAQIEAALQALPAHVERLRQAAGKAGRELRTLINPMIICRPTEREAWAYHDAIVAAQDAAAVDAFQASSRARDSQSWGGHQRDQRAVGGNIQLVGSPQQIADYLLRLKQAGCDGVQISFYDFAPDLEYFGQAVLPLLKQAGLRL